MAIKRGVSLYSYQQAQFFKQMDWKAQIREVHDNLKTDGIEIIDEATIHRYPFPTEEFIADWNNYMARYEMKAVTMDVYLDAMQFRDHVMNYHEAAERLKRDLKIAASMGFENVRCLSGVPIDVIELALPTAEKLGVRIGKEIHAPMPIKPNSKPKKNALGFEISSRGVEEVMALADRTGSKFVGLVPDFGIFLHEPSDVTVDYFRRNTPNPDAVDFIRENGGEYDLFDLIRLLDEKFPGHSMDGGSIEQLSLHESCAKPEDIRDIVPYIVSIHGKFYHMTEIPGRPGEYEDKSIYYEEPIRILKEEGFDGYIDSEYEGQRHQQDRGEEFLPDEVEEVRRHHEMLDRLINA